MRASDRNLRARTTGDRGQVLPLVVVVVWLAAVALVVVVRLGDRVDTAGRAQAAADAAALAGASAGESEARSLAAANGGDLLRFRRLGSRVDVTVGIGAVHRSASAEAVVEWMAVGAQPGDG